MSKKPPSLEEEAELYAKWDRHHRKHGTRMSRWEYLRKAAGFNRAGAGRMVRGDSVKYNHQNGEFLIEKDGKILSYGPPGS